MKCEWSIVKSASTAESRWRLSCWYNKHFVATAKTNAKTFVIRFAGHAGLAALFISVALFGILSGVMFAYAGDLPLISGLDDYAPSAITRVYASNGETLGEFATERRLVISYDEISPYLRNAIISAEDKDFNNHFGLSVSAMLVRLSSDLARRRMVAGASTLTMQLARNLFAERSGIHPRRQEPRAQDQGDPRRDPDRKALHEARNPHLLLQSDAFRPRHERRRGRRRGCTSASARRT